MTYRLPAAFAAAVLSVSSTACTQTASPPSAPAVPAASTSGVTPSTFALPAGGGCSGEVSRYRAVMDNDLSTGHVAKAVHGRVSAEIDEAATACAAGRDAEAMRMIAATKARYGYR